MKVIATGRQQLFFKLIEEVRKNLFSPKMMSYSLGNLSFSASLLTFSDQFGGLSVM